MEELTPEELKHLRWIYNRMQHVHKENPNVDYMHKLDQIINKLTPHKHDKEKVGPTANA